MLRLGNLISYGTEAPVLDYAGFHVACPSGMSGQGKSAVLDALTWPSGDAPGRRLRRFNPAPDLLRSSEREMSAEAEFDDRACWLANRLPDYEGSAPHMSPAGAGRARTLTQSREDWWHTR